MKTNKTFHKQRTETKRDHAKRLLGIYRNAAVVFDAALLLMEQCALGHHGVNRVACAKCQGYVARSQAAMAEIGSLIEKRMLK